MNCLCARTRRVARLLTQRYEEALRPANLTPAQFELLAEISARPGIAQSALAQRLAIDQTTLSRSLNLLLKRNLLTRDPSPQDRRQTTYSLAAEGHAAWHQALPLWQSVQHDLHHRLGDHWPRAFATMDHLIETLEP